MTESATETEGRKGSDTAQCEPDTLAHDGVVDAEQGDPHHRRRVWSITRRRGSRRYDGSSANADTGEPDEHEATEQAACRTRFLRRPSSRTLNVSLAALAMLMTIGIGYLKYQVGEDGQREAARQDAVQVAKDSTVAMLSYNPDNAGQALNAAGDGLTGTFKDSYDSLVRDVVIPGAAQKRISATATVQAAAASTTTATHSVVMLFVNQTITSADGAPTATASVVQVVLDKVDGRWLVSDFEPK